MQGWFNYMEVEHLARTCPMLLTCEEGAIGYKKPFRQNWVENDSLNSFIAFKENIKRVKTTLTKWSKDTYGDIFKQLVIREDIVKIKEKLFEEHPSAENRQVLQRAQVEFKRHLNFDRIFWQQKAGYGSKMGIEIQDILTAL
ncbi:hypothetical protein KY284_008166 [Solanum tuberosum]|nr:hypothetical protein KY284_008166 [Solanum tuberosum]